PPPSPSGVPVAVGHGDGRRVALGILVLLVTLALSPFLSFSLSFSPSRDPPVALDGPLRFYLQPQRLLVQERGGAALQLSGPAPSTPRARLRAHALQPRTHLSY